MTKVRTTCPYCGVGCGIEVNLTPDGEVNIQGDKEHPANYGRLCSKGMALAQTLDLSDRLLYPQVAGKQTDWDTALNVVAKKFGEIIDQHGPDAVAFYVSGQLLTEDYYVANKLMKGFIGSGNIDTNSRLCMSSSVVGHKRAFGSDTVPGNYEDWERCELIVLTGSNTAWCHPVLYQRLVKAKQDNPDLKVVVIDPRRTATCDIADLHLPIKPGSDAYLFNGLFNWLYANGYADEAFIDRSCEGLETALATARGATLQSVARDCDLEQQSVSKFFRWFGDTDRTLTVYSQGINQSSSGSDKVNAIINCHLLTGRIGAPGMGPFSVTGQPNAMGGREVGALANQLAAHMDYDCAADVERVSRFWGAANMSTRPGLKAVDLFNAVNEGKVKALWVMATNPAVSMPDAGAVREALKNCEFLVVSENIAETDTTKFADVLLPALAWGERDGTVTNSERRISRQRAFLDAPGEARADWWILSRFAKSMGFAGFDYHVSHQIFGEHAALSAFENNGSRDFDLSALVDLEGTAYDVLQPVQWPLLPGKGDGARMFSDGVFFTLSGKARFVGVEPRPPVHGRNLKYPLLLNTGRVRDQWHTMTRSGKAPRLNQHIKEPFVQLNRSDAEGLNINNGDLLRLESQRGSYIAKADVSDAIASGHVFAPIHWNDQFSYRANIGALIEANTDPFSGQPEFKQTRVSIKVVDKAWYGLLLSRRKLSRRFIDYWTLNIQQAVYEYRIAGESCSDDWSEFVRGLLGTDGEGLEWSELLDSSGDSYRAAIFRAGILEACVYIDRQNLLPASDWLVSLFSQPQALHRTDRIRILAGSPSRQSEDQGKVVCSCFNVGHNRIRNAIRSEQLSSVEEIGRCLQAGTNCGSCVPELNTLLQSTIAEEVIA